MNYWHSDGSFSLHVFHKNNELAGYCPVLHAMQLLGITGEYGRRFAQLSSVRCDRPGRGDHFERLRHEHRGRSHPLGGDRRCRTHPLGPHGAFRTRRR
jgi:hypothetical protein